MGGAVEKYDINHYLDTRHDWGQGGLITHDLTHAYHVRFVIPSTSSSKKTHTTFYSIS